MKNLFALAFVACSLALVSCGSKATTEATDTTAAATVVAPADTTPVVAADTTPVVDTTKKEEVKK